MADVLGSRQALFVAFQRCLSRAVKITERLFAFRLADDRPALIHDEDGVRRGSHRVRWAWLR
jgi:hypothetical protein